MITKESTLSSNHFSFLLPQGQDWFTPKEVAAIIGRTDQFVRDALDNQRILGHASSARGTPKRRTYHIHRDGLLLFLLESANYEPRDKLERLGEILRHCNAEERRFFHKYLVEN